MRKLAPFLPTCVTRADDVGDFVPGIGHSMEAANGSLWTDSVSQQGRVPGMCWGLFDQGDKPTALPGQSHSQLPLSLSTRSQEMAEGDVVLGKGARTKVG